MDWYNCQPVGQKHFIENKHVCQCDIVKCDATLEETCTLCKIKQKFKKV